MRIPKGYRELREGESAEELKEKGLLDEMCKCGALRSAHAPFDGPAQGHGPCPPTDCSKFTWVGFLVKVM